MNTGLCQNWKVEMRIDPLPQMDFYIANLSKALGVKFEQGMFNETARAVKNLEGEQWFVLFYYKSDIEIQLSATPIVGGAIL